jgi:hypothetical protein
MRILLYLSTALALFSTASFASGIAVCEKDELTMEQINSVDPSERIQLTNAKGEMVGALSFTDADKTELSALFLCGPNSGYYYVNHAKTSDWIGPVGEVEPIGTILNDEYESEATAKTLQISKKIAQVEITVNIKFTGEPEYADYEPFEATFYADLPVKWSHR